MDMFDILFDDDEETYLGEGDTGTPVTQITKVYRVEMPNGNGPYNSGLPNSEEIYWTITRFGCCRLAEHEQFNHTSGAFFEAHGDASYGCETLRAIHNWFPEPARRYLTQYDCKIIVYELDIGQPLLKLEHGEVVFNRKAARRVDTMELI